MDWFSFIAGALAGWILEWLIDLFYWRRRQSRWAATETRLQADLSHSQNMVGGMRAREVELSQQLSMTKGDLGAAANNLSLLQGELGEAHTQIDSLRSQLALAETNKQALADHLNAEITANEAEVKTLREQLERSLAEAMALQAENASLQARTAELESNATRFATVGGLTAAAVAAQPGAAGDDLTIIEGIGPKIAELLNQNGIRTFGELGNTEVDELEAILRGGGSRFSTANPETWPRQARLAANRDWTRLDALKAQLLGGVRRPGDEALGLRSQAVRMPEPQDDLALIEGIGPKIAEILNANGIRTFAQLARTDAARLRLLLDEAGPAYRIADPTSWPEQASWAAVGNWDRLEALKDQLNAGRRLD